MLANQIVPALQHMFGYETDNIWLQQDGAPHYGRNVSPDLNPVDFFFWGHMKNVIYQIDIHNLHETILEKAQLISRESISYTVSAYICQRIHDTAPTVVFPNRTTLGLLFDPLLSIDLLLRPPLPLGIVGLEIARPISPSLSELSDELIFCKVPGINCGVALALSSEVLLLGLLGGFCMGLRQYRPLHQKRNCLSKNQNVALLTGLLSCYIVRPAPGVLHTPEMEPPIKYLLLECYIHLRWNHLLNVALLTGLLSCYIVRPAPGVLYTPEMEPPIECYVKVLLVYLNSKSAIQRLVTGLVVAEWGKLCPPSPLPTNLTSRVLGCLTENVYYDEIALSFTRLLQDTRDFIATLKHYKLPFDHEQYGKVLTLEQIQQLTGPVSSQLLASNKLKPKVAESLEERRRAIQGAVSQTASDQQLFTVSTQAALVGAVLMLKCLPEKLSHIVKPLMESVKREKNEILQTLSATHLARLVDLCVERTPCPNSKIITNLCTLLRSDPEFTPRIVDLENSSVGSSDSGVESSCSSRTTTPTLNNDKYSGVLTLQNQQKVGLYQI
ncbi:hypothetical protein J6590_056562 [Homalodisca vitripennis]|nr:hypothetical protein J6590_056562 [Homalodisca vitripennis]